LTQIRDTAANPRIPLVAVVGNPNAGKTTLFNTLTGSHQKVGNYPGVTVERVSGRMTLDGLEVEVTDVPGLYSLEPVSEDERVAVEVLNGLEGRRPDLLVCVVDAGNLERNLYFFSQLAEREYPMVVALTMVDLLRQKGKSIDVAKLSNMLGVDVIPVVGHKGRGLKELREAIDRNLFSPKAPNREIGLPHVLEAKVAALRERLARAGYDFSKAEVRKALLGRNPEFEEALGEVPELLEALTLAQSELQKEGLGRPGAEVASRYEWSAMVQKAVLEESGAPKSKSLTDRIDQLLTHRVFGLMFFVGLMYLVFQSIYSFATPLMDGIGAGFSWLGDVVSPWLAGAPIVQSLVVEGLIGGVGTMLTFLPQIVILFFFIAVLEGTGYLARAAFLMDRLLGWCGLNGRAFIPLLSSFACAIPGIMAARVMPDKKSRLATILIAPLMSCSARLPVYLLLIGAFIEPRFGAGWAGFALFAMHFLGLIIAIPVVFILNRGLIKGKRLPFLLELPPYQWPKWRDVWIAMYFRGKVFVQTAGTIIVVLSVLIWALLYFPRSEEAIQGYRAEYTAVHAQADEAAVQRHVDARLVENSYLGRFGKAIEPAFVPAGFDWRLSTAILAAFPAREVVVSSLGIIFSLGGEVDEASGDLRGALQEAKWPDGRPLVTPWTAIGLMVFFALCCQCMATLATVKRETNSWKWAAFMFLYMTSLAYLGAVGVHQLGLWLG
jgi:ferrous iron transport protein B